MWEKLQQKLSKIILNEKSLLINISKIRQRNITVATCDEMNLVDVVPYELCAYFAACFERVIKKVHKSHLVKTYKKALIFFDGYMEFPSFKKIVHKRR